MEDASKSGTPWWRVSLRAKGVAVLAVPMAALFAALFSIYWVELDVRDADQVVARAYETRSDLMQLHSSLADAETAVTVFSATGQARFNTVLETARTAIGNSQSRLTGDIGDDAHATTSLNDIRRDIAEVVDLLDRVRRGDTVSVNIERTRMAELQARITLLSEYEERRFTEARYQRDLARQRLFRTIIVCGILGPIGALFMHLLIASRMVRRLHTVEENARRLAHGLPLNPPPGGTDEIAAVGQQLENAAVLLQGREREVRESEERYRDLFDHAPIPHEETDRSGTIRRFNPALCALLKCDPARIAGRPVWDFSAPDEQEASRTAFLERIESGAETPPFQREYVLDDGTHLTVEIHESLIRNEAGEVTGTVRSILDVTERKMAATASRKVEQYAMELRNRNEQLAHALEGARSATAAKSRFLASVSHELRTPLNGIIGFSELLYDGKLGPLAEEQRDVLADILNSSRHLLELISDVLDLSKIEAGRMEFRPERHRVLDLVLEVRDVVRPLAEKKLLALTVDAPAELIASIDAGRFKQVLYNYLSNAVKFTPDGGSVQVHVASNGTKFRLEVRDTGIGIAREELPRLFQEFEQLSNSRKADAGTGLGLALTKHIVEAQGGTVGVETELGRGSVFFAELPLDTSARPATS